jgi:mutator protein MutT
MNDVAEVPTVRCIVRRPGGDVLLLRKSDDSKAAGLLEFPGGKIDPGTDPLEAVIREVREETGIDLSASPPVACDEYRYRFEHAGTTHHRRVHVFLAELAADPGEVVVNRTRDADGGSEDKHAGYVWVSRERLAAVKAQGRLNGNSTRFEPSLSPSRRSP